MDMVDAGADRFREGKPAAAAAGQEGIEGLSLVQGSGRAAEGAPFPEVMQDGVDPGQAGLGRFPEVPGGVERRPRRSAFGGPRHHVMDEGIDAGFGDVPVVPQVPSGVEQTTRRDLLHVGVSVVDRVWAGGGRFGGLSGMRHTFPKDHGPKPNEGRSARGRPAR